MVAYSDQSKDESMAVMLAEQKVVTEAVDFDMHLGDSTVAVTVELVN